MIESSLTPSEGYPPTVDIFRKMEKEGLCDGFLWPYEGGRLKNLHWMDGEKAVPYETTRGTLWMRQGVHKHYGFAEDFQFAKAARRGRLLANKLRGIITIGGLRIRQAGGRMVYLMTQDCPVKLQFVANSPEEEALTLDLLSRNFGNDRIFSTGGFLGGVYFPTSSFASTFRVAMRGKYRRDLFFLMILGFVTALLTLAGVFFKEGLLGASLTSFFFVLLAARSCHKIMSERALDVSSRDQGAIDLG